MVSGVFCIDAAAWVGAVMGVGAGWPGGIGGVSCGAERAGRACTSFKISSVDRFPIIPIILSVAARSRDCAKLLPICTQALAAVLSQHSSLADLLVCNSVKQGLCCCYAYRLYVCVQQFATCAI